MYVYQRLRIVRYNVIELKVQSLKNLNLYSGSHTSSTSNNKGNASSTEIPTLDNVVNLSDDGLKVTTQILLLRKNLQPVFFHINYSPAVFLGFI